MDIKYKHLYPSLFAEVYIDPTLYDKDNLVADILNNYKIQPYRSLWKNAANIHHYYNDWDNSQFKKLNLESLQNVYYNLFEKFINDCSFQSEILWQYVITNITVHKEAYNFMTNHDHFNDVTFFTVVHYLQIDDNASPLTLENPYSFANYFPDKFRQTTQKILDSSNPFSSTYFKHWNVIPEVDTMYIFPSWIKHKIDPHCVTLQNHRICVVCNIDITDADSKYN